jgi:hypothetical protein
MRALGRLRGWPPAPNQRTDQPPSGTSAGLPTQFIFDSRPFILGRVISKPKRGRQLPPAAFRILARGAKKSLKRTRPYFDVPPFPDERSIFRIEKIVAFGGGVKMQFSKSKKGGRGAGSLGIGN